MKLKSSEKTDSTSPGNIYSDLLEEAWNSAASKVRHTGDLGVDYYPQFEDRPVDFHREVLGRTLWEASEYTINALHEHKYVSIRACRKVSKTHTASGIVAEFMSTAPTIVVTTAPTQVMVKKQLWAEIRSAKSRAQRPLPGKIFTQNWDILPDWYAIGFATNEPENMLGFHAGVEPPKTGEEAIEALNELKKATKRRLLYVFDESQGIDPIFFDSMLGSASGDNVYVLVQGNPTRAGDDPHPYVRSHYPGSGFHTIHISAIPLLDKEDPLKADASFQNPPSWLVPDGWVEKCGKIWGKESPAYLSFVKGLFASAGTGKLHVITEDMLTAAQNGKGWSNQGRHIGIDVARSPTGDEAVASLWVNGVKMGQHQWRGMDFGAQADLIVALMVKWGDPNTKTPVPSENVHVDVTGLGVGVLDRLSQKGYIVDGVDFGSSATGDWHELTGDIKFKNRRAELHWVYRRAMEEGFGHLPAKWEDSWQQAKWPCYELRTERGSGSELIIEPKDGIRDRYGRSPDVFESDILAWSRANATPTIQVWSR